MRLLKKILLIGLWTSIFIIWIVGGLFYFQASNPASETPRPIIFKINKGMTLKQVAHALAYKDLIRSPSSFRLVAYLQDKQSKIQAGEFELSPSMSPLQLLNRITSGQAVLHSVTIPEGYRIEEIASILKAKKIANPRKFIVETHNKSLIASMSIPGNSLEGYLFPDTYYFNKGADEKTIVKTMLHNFIQKIFKPEHIKRAKERGMSFHEIITLASIIEKETGQSRERELISAVFHNRIKKNMRLQSDPTVIYGLPNFDGNIHKKDLSYDSPYNTYRYRGLPPGPIASPGLHSIQAALYPSKVSYLYFVSRKDGSHQFSDNLKDHNRAVRKYQLKRRH